MSDETYGLTGAALAELQRLRAIDKAKAEAENPPATDLP